MRWPLERRKISPVPAGARSFWPSRQERRRCSELGVLIELEREVAYPEDVQGYNLIIAADGLNSSIRRSHADAFQPGVDTHRTKYIWLGADLSLDGVMGREPFAQGG